MSTTALQGQIALPSSWPSTGAATGFGPAPKAHGDACRPASPRPLHGLPGGLAVAAAAVFASGFLLPQAAATEGLHAAGYVGGLSIPTARTLGEGSVGLAIAGLREHQITGNVARDVSYALGVGVLPWLDVVGRFTENATRDFSLPGYTITKGISDLSANVKASFAITEGLDGPRVALGLNDIAGGAINFKAAYGVATVPLGLLDVSLGYGRSSARARAGHPRALDGAFGGLDLRLIEAGGWGRVHAMAEYDSRQPSIGLRWHSKPIMALAGGTWTTSIFHSTDRGPMPGTTIFGASLTLPFAAEAKRIPKADSPTQPNDRFAVPDGALNSASARLGRLQKALHEAGLERIRVGSALDDAWVVQFENRRWGHSELDALGAALRCVDELAPPMLKQIMLMPMKGGQPVLTMRTTLQAWRSFVADGNRAVMDQATQVVHGDGLGSTVVDWISDEPTTGTLAQARIIPVLSNTLGTEFAAFDYALAARLELGVPMWRGAHLVGAVQQRLAHSRNADPYRPFSLMQAPEGLRTAAIHQSVWLGQQGLVGLAAGLFEGKAIGVEGEAHWFVPNVDDVVHVRGRFLDRDLPQQFLSKATGGASYRWTGIAGTWVEGGWQRYTDGHSGPAFGITRWWGDLGVHFNYRRSNHRQYASLEMSFPLTPRLAPDTGRIQLLGASRWRHGIRTRITDSNTAMNLVEFGTAREYKPSWSQADETLDGGRSGPGQVAAGLNRLREVAIEERWRTLTDLR